MHLVVYADTGRLGTLVSSNGTNLCIRAYDDGERTLPVVANRDNLQQMLLDISVHNNLHATLLKFAQSTRATNPCHPQV